MRDPWLAAILLLALVLRVYGLDHGLPFVYNPDEANIMARALSVAQDPNPHYFLYPSFFFYLLFSAMGGLYVLGRVTGRYAGLGAFEARFFEDPTDFYLVGRAVGVFAALATVALTYNLARRHFGRAVARASALFVSVAYFHVRDAHYLKHDVPMGFLVILALVVFDRAMERDNTWSYIASGVAMGVAFATHYYAIFLAPTFFVCHWMKCRFRHMGRFVTAAAVSAVTFFALSPYVLIDLPEALAHMRANRQVVVDRSLEGGSILFPSLPTYIRFLLEQGLGVLLMGLVVLGWIIIARRGWRQLAFWGLFPLMLLVMVSYTFFAGRYLNPILPCLAVAGGVAIGFLKDRWGTKVAVLVTLIACLQPLYYDIQIGRLFAEGDTRTLAHQWILDEVPTGEKLTIQSYSVPLPQSSAGLQASLEANSALGELDRRGKFSHMMAVAEKSDPTYDLLFMGRGDEKNRIYFDYSEVTAANLEPLISRGATKVVLRYPPDTPPADVAAFFDKVKATGHLLARFSPFRAGTPEGHPYMDNEDWAARRALSHKGPLVEIWSLEDY